MENSCRKKHKPSPKKWILASGYSEFRRNPALIPANAGLFHYAGNNPVRYIDPDGRASFSELYESLVELCSSRKNKYDKFSEYKRTEITEEMFFYLFKSPSMPIKGAQLCKIGKRYYLDELTDFGKLSDTEKIVVLTEELTKLQESYDLNVESGKDYMSNLMYDLGGALFSASSNSSAEEFVLNFLFQVGKIFQIWCNLILMKVVYC